MFDIKNWLWLIPLLPLAASGATALLGPRLLRRHSHLPCVVAVVASCVLSVWVLVEVAGNARPVERYYTWFSVARLDDFHRVLESVDIGFTLRADGLTAIMLVTVTFVG